MEASMRNETLFWLRLIAIVVGLMIGSLSWRLKLIAADIKVIRSTVTQQAKECHNLDTMEVKNK